MNANLERIIYFSEEILKEQTRQLPVGEAILLANRFAEACNTLRAKDESPEPKAT